MRSTTVFVCAVIAAGFLNSSPLLAAHAITGGATDEHPRLLAGKGFRRDDMRKRIARDRAARQAFESLRSRVMPYIERHGQDPAWIVSRLQLYWQTHHTQVYVRNGFYDHASGAAPVPTVRFTGARDASTAYAIPEIADVMPYMGENDQLYLQNKSAEGKPWEWVPQSKTGRVIEAINYRIVGLARDAAFLFWYTGDERCAKFAYDIFDTYMTGLYYREVPLDLNHGHDQTLVGLQSFEVIHEDIVGPLAETYDFMYEYLVRQAGDRRAIYDAAFKKWADLIITNGVPFNNWNLIKARFALQIAAVLGEDKSYADGRGSTYYVHEIIDGAGPRQWSLRRLLDYGYDPQTGVWNESPGYSINVANDYTGILELLDRVFGIDLLPELPILSRAVMALPQLLLPNGYTVAFGDAHYEPLRTAAIEHLAAHAERHGRSAEADRYLLLLATIRALSGMPGESAVHRESVDDLHALFERVEVGGTRPAKCLCDYQTPTFFAPNTSWLIQRNGFDPENALVISQVGSSGNHAHANGIAMELYAHGLSVAPESGFGSGYFQNDYSEYYAQFPAHNTVVVDGVSAYPSMRSQHPLTLNAAYPHPGSPAAAAFPAVTFSDVSFLEPETNADQSRVLSTVRIDEKSGYFVDIFRSRRRDGADRYHDYVYHNLGQSMRFSDAEGRELPPARSDRLSFADGDLIGYDYWWDRKSLRSERPLRAHFNLQLPQRSLIMTMWLDGAANREFFSVQAPPSTAWVPGMLPGNLARMPLQTLVVRQTGEAWTHPFAAVLEAKPDDVPNAVLSVERFQPANAREHATGLRVTTVGDRRQTIYSTDGDTVEAERGGQRLIGRYGIVAEQAGKLDYLFLGDGREIAADGFAIEAQHAGTSAALWHTQGHWFYTGSGPAQLHLPVTVAPHPELQLQGAHAPKRIAGRAMIENGYSMRVFDMPAVAATRIL